MYTSSLDHLDPEDFYRIENPQEIQEFLESHTIGQFNLNADNDYVDYDMDNHGYGDYDY